ncbi:MAG: glycerate kinase [Clostridia bacterium]|nr:glycerate kinase [Clostridia bacterium]
MNFLFASDSFKGSLTSEKISELLTKSALKTFPDCTTHSVLTADGGEGTLDAVLAGTGGKKITISAQDPLGREICACYGKTGENSAIIEMAQASGLPLLKDNERNPLKTSTFGTGELIRAALDSGAKDITIAIGGSATNDGGMGAMSALGVKFFDKDGNLLKGAGEDLEKVADIDITNLHSSAKDAKFTVMCDVNNPLTGENGATYIFGAQKGADCDMQKRLENGMKNYASVIKEKLGISCENLSGGGAAGGLGAALLVFLDAEMKSGIETLLDLINFDELAKKADVIITGEGRMDGQSVCGKVASGVGLRAKKAGKPAFAIVGGMGDGAEKIFDCGICSVMPTVNSPMTLDNAIKNAELLYESAAERLFRIIKASINLK